MHRKLIMTLFVGVIIFLFSSCYKIERSSTSGKNNMQEEQKADERILQIVSAIKADDESALKSLFSRKAIDEADDFDGELDSLFDFIQGDISSWERSDWSSDETVRNGGTSLMLRSDYKVVTDVEEYSFFLIDYTVDTIDPNNEGVYMLEVSKLSYSGEWEAWQIRMRAGISIVE